MYLDQDVKVGCQLTFEVFFFSQSAHTSRRARNTLTDRQRWTFKERDAQPFWSQTGFSFVARTVHLTANLVQFHQVKRPEIVT